MSFRLIRFYRLLLILIFSLLCTEISRGQNITIRGIIVDSQSGQPLPFATIGIKGNASGTASNQEGKFVLQIPTTFADSVFFCSYMGYKPFESRVSDLTPEVTIALVRDVITLNEVEVRPWTPWDYVWNAMKKIPQNYATVPYRAEGYYSEFLSENNNFLKYTEAIVRTWNPPYGTEYELQSEVLKARRLENPERIQFKRKKLEKKYEKEKRKAIKKGEEWDREETIDDEIISSSFGGPENILEEDPLRDTVSFLNIKNREKFIYTIDGYTTRYDQQVIIIAYKSKGAYDHQRLHGKIYISMISDAIIAVEYNSEIVIPALAKPVLFFMGIGIKNPGMYALVQYKPIGDRWYLNDFSMEGNVGLIDKKMFRKNERSDFHIQMSLINQNFDLENKEQIPEEKRIDPDIPLEKQAEPDPEFWDNFQIVRPSMIEK